MEEAYKSILDEILKNEPAQQAPEKEVVEENVEATETTEAVAEETQQESVQETEEQVQETETPRQKEWYEDDEVSEPQTQQTQEPVQEVQQEQTQIELDEDLKLLMEYKKSGKTLVDFVKEYNIVDYSSVDDKTILEMGLSQLEGFTGEELQDAQGEVETMTLFQKKKLVQEYRARFEEMNQEKLKQLSVVNTKQSEVQTQMLDRFNKELDNTVNSVKNQERYGLKITDEMSKALKQFVAEEMSFQRPDGSVDVEALLDVAIWRKYGKDLVRANVTRAKNEGREEILRQTTNPSQGTGSSNKSAGMSSGNLTDAFTQYLKNKK